MAIGRQSTLCVSSTVSKGVGIDRHLKNIARAYCKSTRSSNMDEVCQTLSQSTETPTSSSSSSSSPPEIWSGQNWKNTRVAETITRKRKWEFK